MSEELGVCLMIFICLIGIFFVIILTFKSHKRGVRMDERYEEELRDLEEHFREGRISEQTYLERIRMIERKYDRTRSSDYKPYQPYKPYNKY